jgi:hypothetical protein
MLQYSESFSRILYTTGVAGETCTWTDFFWRRLIDATCKFCKPHKTRVNVGMKEDLKVWLLFLSNCNGTTVILDKFWSSSPTRTLEFIIMACGARTVGANWNFDYHYLFRTFSCSCCSEYLRNKKIIFHVDNQAVVYILFKKSSSYRSPRVVPLERNLVFPCPQF